MNGVKLGRKTFEKEKVVDSLERFYHSREEVFNLFRDYIKLLFDASYEAKKMKLKQQDLNINSLPNTSKITNSLCTNKSRQ